MTRRVAAAGLSLFLSAAIAFAAGAPPAEEESEEGDVESAAVPGRFHELPPSDHSYPTDILAQMRARLSGDDGHSAEKPAKKADKNGN